MSNSLSNKIVSFLSFIEENDNLLVVKNQTEDFKKFVVDVILGEEYPKSQMSIFSQAQITSRETVTLNKYLQNEYIDGVIKAIEDLAIQINEINGNFKKEISDFIKEYIITSWKFEETGYFYSLFDRVSNAPITIEELNKNHVYIASRLNLEQKMYLIEIIAIYHVKIHELESTLLDTLGLAD